MKVANKIPLQSAYFGNQCLSIFTACCYTQSPNNNDDRSNNIIVATKSSDPIEPRLWVFYKKLYTISNTCIKKTYEDVYVWSDGMGSQFKSRCVSKFSVSTVLLGKTLSCYYNEWDHGKGYMDEIGVTVKNVGFRKVKSGQFVVYSPLEFSEAVTIFVPSIHSVYLPENENVVAPEDISKARKIGQTLKIHELERKFNENGDTYINFFKTTDHDDLFNVQWYGGENEITWDHVETSESDAECAKSQRSYNEGEEWLCCPLCHQWYHEERFYE